MKGMRAEFSVKSPLGNVNLKDRGGDGWITLNIS